MVKALDAEQVHAIIFAYFQNQCGRDLAHVKIDDIVPAQNSYIVDCEHRCVYESALRRHRIVISMDGKVVMARRFWGEGPISFAN